jgi:hypothetical protein
MSEIVTLELSEEVARNAKSIAIRTHRRMEEVLVDWIDQVAAELPLEYLSDDQILALCDSQLDTTRQNELSNLLADQREGILSKHKQVRLDELMQMYRRDLVRKAQALKIAVERGLRPPLN